MTRWPLVHVSRVGCATDEVGEVFTYDEVYSTQGVSV